MRQESQWYIILLLAVVAIVLIFVGLVSLPVDVAPPFERLLQAAGRTMRTMTFRYEPQGAAAESVMLAVGRTLWLFVVVVGGAKATIYALRKDLRLTMAAHRHDHIVVCGLGDLGELIATTLSEEGRRVIPVEKDPEAKAVERLQEKGLAVIIGDARDEATLEAAGIGKARALIATCGSNTTNLEIIMNGRAISRRVRAHKRPPLAGIARVDKANLRRHLARYDELIAMSERFEFRVLDIAENTARLVLRKHPPISPFGPADGAPPHLLVVGLGDTGQAVVVHCLRLCHNPSEVNPRITIIDERAEERERMFRALYPTVDQVCDMTFVTATVDDAGFQDGALIAAASEAAPITGAYVCLDDDDASIAAALDLRRLLSSSEGVLPIFVHVPINTRLGTLLDRRADPMASAGDVIPFGDLQKAANSDIILDERLDRLARSVHDRYRSIALEGSDAPSGMPSVMPWPQLPEIYRASNRRLADQILFSLRFLGLEAVAADTPQLIDLGPAECELLARLEHRRWCVERILDGWRAGPKRDDTARIHPLLMPWEDLPDDIRQRNLSAASEVPQLLAAVGLEIKRPTT